MEAAFFDLDKTVIAKASVVAFGRSFYREGLISRRLVLRGLYGQLIYMHLGASEAKIARMRESLLALTRGWEKARITEIVEDALTEVVEPIIYAEAADLIDQHRASGHMVVIVSASPEEIVLPLARHLGVETAIASRAFVDDDGRYTGELEIDAFGANKVLAMKRLAAEHGIDLEASYAYSDSATDLPMLEAVGHPVVVNPDRELLRAARERGWEVRTFTRPVRLRDRVPVRAAGPAAALLVSVGAAVGAALWWRAMSRRPPSRPPTRSPGAAIAAGGSLVRRYSTRSFLAANSPRPTRMARRRSFFMARSLPTGRLDRSWAWLQRSGRLRGR